MTRLQPELVSEEKCSAKPKKSCQLRTDSGESVFNTNEKPLIQRFCLKKQKVNPEELENVSMILNFNKNISNSMEHFDPLPIDRARMLISDVISTGVNNVVQLDEKEGFSESRLLTNLEASSSDHDLKLGLEKENFETYQVEMQLGLGFPSEETTSDEYLFLQETTMPSGVDQENLMMYETTTANTILTENSTQQEDIVQESTDIWTTSAEHESSTELSVTYSESSSEERHIFSFLPNSTSASK